MSTGQSSTGPTYDLETIQYLIQTTPRKCIIRDVALEGARLEGLNTKQIYDCILKLKDLPIDKGGHFYKTMPAETVWAAAQGLWQDVYRFELNKVVFYIKLQILPPNKAVVIQFKRK